MFDDMFTTVKQKKIRMMGLGSCVKRRTSYELTYSMAYSGYAFGSSYKNNYTQSMDANATTNVFKRFIETTQSGIAVHKQRNLIKPALYISRPIRRKNDIFHQSETVYSGRRHDHELFIHEQND